MNQKLKMVVKIVKALSLAAFLFLSVLSLSCKKDDNGTGPEEPVSPTITEIRVSSLFNSATVFYETDVPAKAFVEYDVAGEVIVDTMLLNYARPDTEMFIREHEVNLTGLVPNTQYAYRISAWTPSQVDSSSLVNIFSTPDTTTQDTTSNDVLIVNLRITDITDVSAIARWETDLESDSRVSWGLTEFNHPNRTSDPAFITTHAIQITGLTFNTEYFVQVASVTESGLVGVSPIVSFTTELEPSPPIITNLFVEEVTDTSATISWDTNKDADTRLLFGLSEETLDDSVTSSDLVMTHSIDVFDLEPNTLYYAKAASVDDGGLRGESDVFTILTLTDISDTLLIFDVSVDTILGRRADISWLTNRPADTRIFYGTDRYNFTSFHSNDTLRINHAVSLTGLEYDTQYYFALAAEDAQQATAESDTFEFRTNPPLTITLPDTTVSIGTFLELPIYVEWAEDVAGIELLLDFDRTIVTPIRVDEGPFVLDNNHFFFENEIDLAGERITIQATWRAEFVGDTPVGTDADGSGVLAIIRFNTDINGNSPLEFIVNECRAFNVNSELMEIILVNGRITVEE